MAAMAAAAAGRDAKHRSFEAHLAAVAEVKEEGTGSGKRVRNEDGRKDV